MGPTLPHRLVATLETLSVNPEIYEMQSELRGAFWWFAARRDLFERILSALPDLAAERFLDIGPGPGTNSSIYHLSNLPTVTVDNEKIIYELWKPPEGVRPLLGDIGALPLESGSFGVVLLLDVIEHLQDERPALREIQRILRDRGHLLISAPALMSLWSWHDLQNHHYRRYSIKDLPPLLVEAGFEVKGAWYFNFLMSIPAFFIRQVTRRCQSQKEKLETELFPGPFNPVFLAMMKAENWLIQRGFHFPWGASVAILAQKRTTQSLPGSSP